MLVCVQTHTTYLHTWGSIFVQDVLIPWRGVKPKDANEHFQWLSRSILLVAVLIFLWCAGKENTPLLIIVMLSWSILVFKAMPCQDRIATNERTVEKQAGRFFPLLHRSWLAPTRDYVFMFMQLSVQNNAVYCAIFFCWKSIICQDRLGTNATEDIYPKRNGVSAGIDLDRGRWLAHYRWALLEKGQHKVGVGCDALR